MSIYELSDREAVLEAMAEFDSMARDPFLAKYGFGRSTRYIVLHDGKEYDVKAIAGAAHGIQFPEQGPLKSADFTSGTGTTVPKMVSLGFEVIDLNPPTPTVSADQVTPEEDAALQEMINDTGTSPLVELVSQWRKESGYPTNKAKQRVSEREELAGALTEATLDQAIADPDRYEDLEIPRLAGPAAGGPGQMTVLHRHLAKGPEARIQLTEALRHLLYGEGDAKDRLDDVLAKEEWGAPGFGENLAVKALTVVYPGEWLPVFGFSGNMGKGSLISLPELGIEIPDSLDEMSRGARAKWSNDALREKTEPHIPGDPWGQMKFLYWLRDQAQSADSSESLAALADELLVDSDWLDEVRLLLEEKRQVIFQGPPGTGKTFVARELGRHFEELGGGMEIVQFHPSYAYEDFVEGYRPRLLEGQPGFELVAGPLMRLARQAEADSKHKYVLIIDELNRGNVAKVFGELYFLLEYRGEKIRLQYSEQGEGAEAEESRFGLPKNLWIVATTNTADRSIALMDAALRRRFYFVDYYPDKPPVEGLLERWLERHGHTELFGWLVPVLAEANRLLGDPESAIGPSHFLLRDPADLSLERIERIWNHAVIPYVQEQLVGESERLPEFELPKLRGSIEAAASEKDEGGSVGSAPAVGEDLHDEGPTVDAQAE